jgi:hypothetical protein
MRGGCEVLENLKSRMNKKSDDPSLHVLSQHAQKNDMAEFHSVLPASISTAHISIPQYTMMPYWLHSTELKDGAHHSAASAPLKIRR